MNKSNLVIITIEHTKDITTWLYILSKLSENKYITHNLYEHVSYVHGELVRTNEYCIRIICPSEFIDTLMPLLRIREISDEITFDLDQPELTSQLHRSVGENMESYITSSLICRLCGGSGEDPKYINEACIGCAGSGQFREYNLVKYLDEVNFSKLKPNN